MKKEVSQALNVNNNIINNEENLLDESQKNSKENNFESKEINKRKYDKKAENNEELFSDNAQEIVDKNLSKKETSKSKNKRKKFTVMGISGWRILAYFIIYSVLGFVIETIYGMITKGVLESRQSFLYGPFCGIYGLGAIIMIIFLHKYQTKYNALFIGGFIVGSITEYLVSLFGEMLLGVKWWDYSGMPLNLNGRICVYFSIFWGFLGMYLIASLNPKIDRLINWVKSKFKTFKSLKAFVTAITILLFIDCIATGFALEFFLVRMIVKNDINVAQKELVQEQYDRIYGNEKLSDFIYTFWGDKKMIRTFPNLKIKDADGNIIYMDSLLDIESYYLKIYDKNNLNNQEVESDIKGEVN